MNLTKSARYGILAAVEMARSPHDEPVTVAVVAGRYGIPEAALAKAFQRLVHFGLAVGTRGVHGGYRLARRPAEITVLDVLDVFGPVTRSVPQGSRAAGGDRPAPASERIGRLFDDVDEQLRSRLAAVTLDALAAGDLADALGSPYAF
jgi:Rrf2 family protein